MLFRSQAAYDAGVQVMKLVAEGIKAKDIVTMKSFENMAMSMHTL